MKGTARGHHNDMWGQKVATREHRVMCQCVASLSDTPESNVTSSVIPDEQGPWEAAGGLAGEAGGKQLVLGLERSPSRPSSRAQGGGRARSVLVEPLGRLACVTLKCRCWFCVTPFSPLDRPGHSRPQPGVCTSVCTRVCPSCTHSLCLSFPFLLAPLLGMPLAAGHLWSSPGPGSLPRPHPERTRAPGTPMWCSPRGSLSLSAARDLGPRAFARESGSPAASCGAVVRC